MKMLLSYYRRWYWRRKYKKLAPGEQLVARLLKMDPDSLIDRGLL